MRKVSTLRDKPVKSEELNNARSSEVLCIDEVEEELTFTKGSETSI